MSSPPMMICLRKDRNGGLVEDLFCFYLVFGWGAQGGEDRLHLLHVPGLHILAG